jgi:hypothetical protein
MLVSYTTYDVFYMRKYRGCGLRSEGRVDVTELDGGEDHLRVGCILLEISGVSTVLRAWSTRDTWVARVPVEGILRVEPEHAGRVVSPEGHGENHTALESITHTLVAAKFHVVLLVAEGILLSVAELISDRITWDVGDGGLDVPDSLATLNVGATDFLEISVVSAVSGDELGDDGHLLSSVDGESRTTAVEIRDSHAEGVEIAAVLVADAIVTVTGVVITALCRGRASEETVVAAGMGSVGMAHGVCLPDIHLSAACTVLAGASIRIGLGRLPSFDISL